MAVLAVAGWLRRSSEGENDLCIEVTESLTHPVPAAATAQFLQQLKPRCH